MRKLFEIGKDFEELESMLGDEECSEESIIDTLEGIGGEFEQKAENIAWVLKDMDGESDVIGKEIERLTKRKKALDNRANGLKDYLFMQMKRIGKTKFKTAYFSFGIQNAQDSLVIDNEDDIPDEYKTKKESFVIDKKGIKDALKRGEQLGYAHLVPSENLRIR